MHEKQVEKQVFPVSKKYSPKNATHDDDYDDEI